MPGKPTTLRCEYFVNPLAIDVALPRLSWVVNDQSQGALQTAYQVLVASSPELLTEGKADLWDSGKVKSDQSVHVVYAGKPLQPRTRCHWTVRTWNCDDAASPWSNPAKWEMAFLKREDWQAKWIASPIVGGPYSIPPAPYLRKQFEIAGTIQSARLYVTALGAHEIEINGKLAHDCVLAPGRTEYHKRVPYHVFDVTSHLNPGPNAIGAILGDGWYCGHLHSDPRQTYGDRPRLLAQLEITLTDGSRQVICSDDSWKCGEGPIRSSDMLMGEDYDARMEISGWSSPGFDDAKWQSAIVMPDPEIEIVAHRSPPIRRVSEVKPIASPRMSPNRRRWLFDMGQNMVGRVRLKVRGPVGKTIDLRHSEMLDKDGKPYTTALRTARAIDHYTTKGNAEEVFEPRFTFHGFRYVEVRDYPGTPTVDDLTGVVLHSDLPFTGSFECSDPMINQLQSNIVWSQKGNFLDFPTDCPQRDERLGWTGDAQVFIRTAAFNMDIAGFFTKWCQDMADSQGEDGRIPSVVPHVTSIYFEGGPAWADAAVICPWIVYQCYGDKRMLEDSWEMMTKFLGYLEARCVDFIRADEHWKWKGYGDWLNMNAETPKDLIGTAYYAYCAKLLSQIATILGKDEDAARYAKLAMNVTLAWRKKYVSPSGEVLVKTQTAYVLALHFDLLEASHRDEALESLVADIESRGMHLSTGFVGTPYLNLVLTRYGRSDIAYALLIQKTFPSWLFPITHGATTMWERWDGWTPEQGFNDAGMNSYNHYAYGAVGEWIYANVGGIDLDPQVPGYKHILIRPQPGGGITWAKTALDSMYGKIACAWKISNGRFELKVTIPANTTATIRVPTRQSSSIKGAETLKEQSRDDRSVTFTAGAGNYELSAIA
jgi:alpha-L-rhamnosidase